jgi:hypothetical protein
MIDDDEVFKELSDQIQLFCCTPPKKQILFLYFATSLTLILTARGGQKRCLFFEQTSTEPNPSVARYGENTKEI